MSHCRVSSLEGRCVAVGVVSKVWLEKLLGLYRPGGPPAVTAAAWVMDHVVFAVRTGTATERVFFLESADKGGPSLYVTQHLQVRWHGKSLPSKLSSCVLSALRQRLPPLTMDRVMAVLAQDPQLGDPGLPMPSSATSHPAHQLDTWGAADAWADFFARGEVARGQLDSIEPSKLFRFIQHCDSECIEVNPYGVVPLPVLVDFPWLDRGRSDGVARTTGAHAINDQFASDDMSMGEMLTTNLSEMDVVMGNPGKVRAVLEKAIATHDPHKRVLFFSNTCVPTVSGEDVESVVREFQAKSPTPLVYLTVTPKAMNDVFCDLLVRRRVEAEREAPPPDPMAVNLIGFEPGQATNELIALLGALGVRVHTDLIPNLHLDRILRLPGAALNVFRPNFVWSHYYDQLRENSRVPSVSPVAPIGLEGTKQWLTAVLEGLGVSPNVDAVDHAIQEANEPWEAAKAGAAGVHLGFVIRGEELHFLLDPSQTWGFPVLAFAREAGLGVDVFVQSSDLRTSVGLAGQLATSVEPGPTWSLHGVHTFDALMERLSASPCQAVFGYHFFDWRLSQCGKARFSLQQFELGIAGGTRTIERLTGICTNPFYRTYARHLQRDREGLRRHEVRL